MSAVPSAGGGYGALHLVLPDVAACNGTVVSSEFLAPNTAAASAAGANKRKRRPAGTPDPGAEVVALSPRTLMESDRYVCEICNQGFQRDQNLQMHRRRHKVPWKLLKRPSLGINKRVYICPERSCLHHDPAHALGDLVGIKKHYRRKHCTEKQWKCDKCCKGYAVQSDYKAHLKTCGTRGHCCDCGRVFSRVESFIEHQDTCSAMKHKAVQSEGGSDTRAKSSSAPHHGTRDRNSTASPSQSSDTTQAVSFAHSEMSDTTKTSAHHIKVADEHSRRIQESQAIAATPSIAAAGPPSLPAWLADHGRRNELELLAPSKHQVAAPSDYHHSMSSVTRCSSVNFPYPEVSCPGIEPSAREPSLQLSMGPYGAEVADTKPSFSSVESFLVQKGQTSSAVIPSSSHSDVALSIPGPVMQHGNEGGLEMDRIHVSLSGFLMQAARGIHGDGSKRESNVGHESSTRKQHYQNVSRSSDQMVTNYNSCASTSSYHEDLAANMHESDAPGPLVMSRRGNFINSQLEPAISSVISSRHGLLDHRGVTETDHLFTTNSKSVDEDFRSHEKQMAAGSARAEVNQAREQAWTDLASVRLSRDEARTHECDVEAQRDMARAETLKREAREQLQLAAAERAYAESAREIAKRLIEISETELARAKRLREHAQSELDKASTAAASFQPALCHSCKSALESHKSAAAPTSPNSSTWSFMTPAAATNSSDQPGAGVHLWPAGYRSISTSPASMAIDDPSPPSRPGLNLTNSRSESGRDHGNITSKLDLDLN